MKAFLYLEGTNDGASFLEEYLGEQIHLESLYKDISPDSPPLVELKTADEKVHSLQLIDIRFIDEFIFIHCFVVGAGEQGGKALLRLKPCF